MISFSLTYNHKDLHQPNDELLMKCAPETELVRIDAIAGLKAGVELSPLFTIKAHDSVASPSDVISGNLFPTQASLVFHPEKLATLLPDKEKDWPRRLTFELSLLENAVPISYGVTVDYIGSGNCFYDANLSWRWNEEEQLDLTGERVPDSLPVGTLQMKKNSSPRTIVFRIIPTCEADRTLRFPHANEIKLNEGQHKVGIEKSEDGSFRCAFRKLSSAAHYQLKIGRKWLEDSRISALNIWWEGDFGAQKNIGVLLPQLVEQPIVGEITFKAWPDVGNDANGYNVLYNGEKQKLGELIVPLTDPRGEGYNLKGKITIAGEQTGVPVNLQTANLPAGLSKLSGGGKKSSAFKLKTAKENEVSVSRPFFKTYEHRIPLEIDTRIVDFSSRSPNVEFGVNITLGEDDGATVHKLLLNVTGSSNTTCEILPKQELQTSTKSISLNAKTVTPETNLSTFTVANTRTQSGGKYISFRIENIRLERREPQSPTNWQLELYGDDGPLKIGEDQAIADMITLGSKQKQTFTFRLIAKGGLSTRAPRENMQLAYDVVHFLHEDARPLTSMNATAVREERFLDFTIGPVIERNFISIDLGTSAIVAAHSSSTQGGFDFDFIDLQKQLAEIRVKAGMKYLAEEQPEGGTRFISSNVLLKNNSKVRAEQPRDSLVELAPTFLNLFMNHQRWLPNIKMLFGGQKLSHLKKGFLDDLKVTNAKGEIEKITLGDARVIELSMHALVNSVVNHFVLPQAMNGIKESDNLTEIVFTVPNNFSEKYRQDISRWATIQRSVDDPGISVSFVSESDAIAFAYLDQGNQINHNKLRERPEIILTYDIGAGTVDLSLVERSVNPIKHSESVLEVIGRIGLPKAGNYLDYVIAKIVWELYGIGSLNEMVIIANPFEQPDSPEARAYHSFIRNELKPEISKFDSDKTPGLYKVNSNSKLFGNPDKQTISIQKIQQHPLFKTYLKEITEKALEKLFYNAFGDDDYKTVNTILYSGRSSQMKVIKESFLEALEQMSNQDIKAVEESSPDAWSMGDLNLVPEKLKGIVALGGLRYLKKYRDLDKKRGADTLRLGERHITSSYGLIYNYSNTSTQDWRYLEMVNPRNDDDSEVSHEEMIDFGGADRVYLIQTFEQHVSDIMKGFSAGKFTGDYTVGLNNGQPIIFSSEGIDVDEIVSVVVSVKEGRSLRFTLIGEQSTSILYSKNLTDYQLGYNTLSPALAQSLWPFIGPRK